MFFILQILAYAALAVVIVTSVSVAAVWVKRQTHVRMTPGQLAKDRVMVAEADRDIMRLAVEREVHNFHLDRVLDARTDPEKLMLGDGSPLPLRLDPTGYKLLDGSSGHKAKVHQFGGFNYDGTYHHIWQEENR